MAGDISIGKSTFIGHNTLVTGGKISIGANCDISANVTIHAGSHIIGDKFRRAGEAYMGNVVIGDGVWIGVSVVIIDGAIIGDSTIVAAGSTVIGQLEPNSLYAGVPAKKIKSLK